MGSLGGNNASLGAWREDEENYYVMLAICFLFNPPKLVSQWEALNHLGAPPRGSVIILPVSLVCNGATRFIAKG